MGCFVEASLMEHNLPFIESVKELASWFLNNRVSMLNSPTMTVKLCSSETVWLANSDSLLGGGSAQIVPLPF